MAKKAKSKGKHSRKRYQGLQQPPLFILLSPADERYIEALIATEQYKERLREFAYINQMSASEAHKTLREADLAESQEARRERHDHTS